MTDLAEKDLWEPGIRQFETSDSVMGGPDGVDNIPPRQLANRTVYLRNRIAEILGVSKTYVLAGGTANAITASYTPAVAEVVDGQVFRGRVQTANKGATTFTPNPAKDGIAPSPVYGLDGQPLSGGEIVGKFALEYDSTLNDGKGGYVLTDNPGGIVRGIAPASTDNSAARPTTSWIRNLFAPLVSPAFSGSPQVPTAAVGNNTTLAASTAFVLAQIASGIQSLGKINAANNPNLQFNGSGEFGTSGWLVSPGPAFGVFTDAAGGLGTYFSNGSAMSGATGYIGSPQVPALPSVALTETIDVANFQTAGTLVLTLAAFNSSSVFISNLASVTVANGTALQRYTLSGTTPAGTSYVQAYWTYTGVSAPAFGVIIRRVKIEQGLTPSLYSQEASIAAGTAPQLDNSTRLATTAFVTQMVGNFKGALGLVESSTIASRQVGYEFQTTVPGLTTTLPHPNTVSGGSVLALYNNSPGTQTLSVPGGNFNTAYGAGTSVVVIPPNACVALVSDNTSWNGIGGAGAVGATVRPTATAGVGQWTSLLISPGTNGALSLPPGGTWAYFYFNQTTAQSGVGIAAGGTVLLTGAAAGGPGISQASGFCWRIAQ